jgi:hypothetical protein
MVMGCGKRGFSWVVGKSIVIWGSGPVQRILFDLLHLIFLFGEASISEELLREKITKLGKYDVTALK